ncbi:hypothetical protein YC2023_089521 [Brassica napus]
MVYPSIYPIEIFGTSVLLHFEETIMKLSRVARRTFRKQTKTYVKARHDQVYLKCHTAITSHLLMHHAYVRSCLQCKSTILNETSKSCRSESISTAQTLQAQGVPIRRQQYISPIDAFEANATRMVKTEIFSSVYMENNWYSIKVFKIKTNICRTRTANNIFNLKFTISTIVKHIAFVSSSLYFYSSKFADIIHRPKPIKTIQRSKGPNTKPRNKTNRLGPNPLPNQPKRHRLAIRPTSRSESATSPPPEEPTSEHRRVSPATPGACLTMTNLSP